MKKDTGRQVGEWAGVRAHQLVLRAACAGLGRTHGVRCHRAAASVAHGGGHDEHGRGRGALDRVETQGQSSLFSLVVGLRFQGWYYLLKELKPSAFNVGSKLMGLQRLTSSSPAMLNPTVLRIGSPPGIGLEFM